MKELMIHIGTHKTGTTSIQKVLSDSRTVLLEKHGILYPSTGRPSSNYENRYGHGVLARSLSGKIPGGESIFYSFRCEVEKSEAKRIVISAEGFSRLSREQIVKLASEVQCFDCVTIILYLRNVLGYLRSAYKQQVSGRQSEYLSFFEFCIRNVHFCDYSALISDWAESFGRSALRVRVFDKAVQDSGLISNFLGILSYEEKIDLPKKVYVNTSETDAAIKVLRQLNNLSRLMPDIYTLQKISHRTKRFVIRHDPGKFRIISEALGPIIDGPSIELINAKMSEQDCSVLREYLSEYEFGLLSR